MIKNLALTVPAVAEKAGTTPTPNWMVVAMGVGVVFVGLILIILICKVMGLFFSGSTKEESKPVPTATPVATSAKIENRQEIIAAVTAACAEDMGTDVSALRVISFKKL